MFLTDKPATSMKNVLTECAETPPRPAATTPSDTTHSTVPSPTQHRQPRDTFPHHTLPCNMSSAQQWSTETGRLQAIA